MPYTREQKRIIRDVNASKNVRVIAVAGSGKTSTILGTIPNHGATLVLCYNNRLRDETQSRIGDGEGGEAFDVHTFHSFVYNTLGEELATTDIGIVRMNAFLDGIKGLPRKELVTAIRSGLPQQAQKVLIGSGKYTRIIIDEAQDLTPEYYALAMHLLRITGASLTLLGDPRQAIYQFNGATDKYLRNASLYFEREFVDRTLSMSFRVPKMVAMLVNEACTGDGGQDIIPASKSRGIKPMIYFESVYEKMDMIIDMIKKVPPGDVMILMYSTRRDAYRPSITVANTLIEAGVPVSFNGITSSSDASDESVLMISYHQSKGLERPIVICLDMGEYYFNLNPDVRVDILPNLWYVAMTRASKFLIAFIDRPFEFITRGLKAIGFDPPTPSEMTDGGAPPTNVAATASSYISRGFDNLVKYSPTSIQVELMARREYPERFVSIGVGSIAVNAADLVAGLMCEFTRARLLDAKIDPDGYIAEYKKVMLGGLRGVRLNVGHVMLGKEKLSTVDAISRGYDVASHILDVLHEYPTSGIRGEYGNTEINTQSGSVVIIVTGPTIEARLRVASFWTKKTIIIDVVAGSYVILGGGGDDELVAKDHTVE